MPNLDIVNLIRKGEHNKALDELYKNYSTFENAFTKSGGKRSDAADVYQEALFILIEKVKNKEFTLTCSIHTFLFGICNKLSMAYVRKKDKFTEYMPSDFDSEMEIIDIDEIVEREAKFAALDKTLEKIGKKCLEILTMFYHQGLKMALVAEKLGFKSETSAKTQKYKCIEKAKGICQTYLVQIQTETL